MDSEKQVTFSPEVTLRVYEPRSEKSEPISAKARLGGKLVRKTQMKPAKVSSAPFNMSKMKSDLMKAPSVHSRLYQKNNQKSVFKRLGE